MLAGSGPGGSPLWAPRALPEVERRLAVAQLAGGNAAVLARLATQLMLERDGSLQLQACHTPTGRLALRIRTRLHDLMWWRRRQVSDPWDSGHVRDTAAGLRAITHWMPRRASLLVVDHLAADLLSALLGQLQARQARFACPVRLLVLGPMPAREGLGATSLPPFTPIVAYTPGR